MLDRINYNFVTNVNELKELERQLSRERNSGDSFTVILADGKFDLNEIVLSKRCSYFVCLPRGSAVLSFSRGLFLSDASFLFENVHFENSLPSANRGQPLSSKAACSTEEREELLSGKSHLIKEEVAAGGERELNALIEANDVTSLVMDHCSVNFSNRTGLLVRAHHRQQVIVSVKSTAIHMSRGPGIVIQGGTAVSHISICDSKVEHNMYGIIMATPARFYMEKNSISDNVLDGIVAAGGCNGGLLRNSLGFSQHAILLKTTFENNCCGGLRVMLNGRGNVLVEKCEFRKILVRMFFPPMPKKFAYWICNARRCSQVTRNLPLCFIYVISFN